MADSPLLSFAEDGRYGQLTYVRLSGYIRKGDLLSYPHGQISRLPLSGCTNEMEEIIPGEGWRHSCSAECASGDTFSGNISWSMTLMHIAPVYCLPSPKDNKARDMSSLNRFCKEDPTFKSFVDHETGETIISGMGELHLDVYIERMKREYKAEVDVGAPRVAYRETITKRAEFDYTHKKQTGGSGQFGRVAGWLEPLAEGE
jgi:elongation factor G